MRSLLGLTAIIASLYGAALAAVAPADGITRVVKWKQFPAPAAMAVSTQDESSSTPRQTPLVTHLDYAELYDRQGRPHACLTFKPSEPGFATVIYYSPAGQSTLYSTGLEPPVTQLTTLTFLATPSDSGGLTLLTLWRQPPSPTQLAQLMLNGVLDSQASTEPRLTQWFKRQAPSWRTAPWLDTMRQQPEPPPGYTRNDWPLCFIEALPDQTVRAKDCVLAFPGLVGFSLDRDGSFGYWRLSWDAPLVLHFDLPGPALPRQARLLVYAQADGTFTWSGLPALDIKVNSWGLGSAPAPASQLLITQPIAVDVSQNLDLGMNTIEIGVSTFSNVSWRVRRIELWAE
jgi:hypothetical protein